MTDVTVLGAGIFGLSIAWSCQQKGARVRVIDPGGPGAGASGGVVGALAPHVPENWNEKKAFQLESLLMANSFWADVEAASGISPGYARLGRLQPIADERMLERSRLRADAAKDVWHGEATWQVIEAGGFEFAPDSPTGYLIFDTLSARIHPRQACASLAAAIIKRGGQIMPNGETVGRVVHATGAAGLADLTTLMRKPIGDGIKGQGAVLDFAAPTMPQVFANNVHIIPHENGLTAIGSTSEREYTDPYSTDHLLDDVIDRAAQAVPALKGAKVVERWAGIRPRALTKGRTPVLGAHPFYDGEFIANGGFKIGFGIAPLVGRMMADLVLDDVNHIPTSFSPDRLT